MKAGETRRRGNRLTTFGSGGDLLDRNAVEAAVQRARNTMSVIVQDAREFRSQSNASLRTISDQALRESVGAKSKQIAPKRPAADTARGAR